MLRYTLMRCLSALVVILGVVTVIFFTARLAGDPVLLMIEPGATEQEVQELREVFGLDRPLPEQFVNFLTGAVTGDFGDSLRQRRSAFDVALERLPATLLLVVSAVAFAVVSALILGITAAIYKDSWLDRAAMSLSVIGQSIPNFWLGLMLILVMSTTFRLLPSAGIGTFWNLILPVITLASFPTAQLSKLVRNELLQALNADYVRAARAKGVSETAIVLRHALGNISLPLITIVAVDFGSMMGGAVVTETVFAWPGTGRLMIQAIGARDFPIIQASAFIIAGIVVVTTLLADIAYALVNPKIRYA